MTLVETEVGDGPAMDAGTRCADLLNGSGACRQLVEGLVIGKRAVVDDFAFRINS